jgi:hypothetical protein
MAPESASFESARLAIQVRAARFAPAREPDTVRSGKSESRRRGADVDLSSGESKAEATIRD